MRGARKFRIGAVLLAMLLSAAAAADGGVPVFSDDEKALIRTFGPWPAETAPDPSNRVSGVAAAIAFGRALFGSRELSADRGRSCATCHDPARAFTDGRPVGEGLARVDRNTIALHNLRLNRWFGWDGKSDSLWAQSIHPILDARELALTPEELRSRISGEAPFAGAYRAVFGTDAAADPPEGVLVNVAKALAAYQETIVTPRTAFDDFRDALMAGDAAAMARYPAAAQRGLRIFVGKGMCDRCHFGPDFTHGEFHDIGLPHFAAKGRVDPGRYGGIKLLRASRFNLLGPYNDDPERRTAGFTSHVTLTPRNWGEFRVPSLRNVAHTAPYMHDGSKATLEDVVRHYSDLDESRLHVDGERLLRPLGLSEREIADLVAFLGTL